MVNQWDLAVYDRNEQLVLAVEVKKKLDATPEWAAQLRRNILAHGVYPNAPFFLLASPNRFFLWNESDTKRDDVAPDYIIDAEPILRPYFEQVGLTPGHISGSSLELIIALWLGEFIHRDMLPEQIEDSEYWLVDSGLLKAIVGGRFANEVHA